MSFFAVLFGIGLIVVLGVNIARFIRNENSPVLTEAATLRRKINNTSMDANGVASTTLTLVFDLPDGALKCFRAGYTGRWTRG